MTIYQVDKLAKIIENGATDAEILSFCKNINASVSEAMHFISSCTDKKTSSSLSFFAVNLPFFQDHTSQYFNPRPSQEGRLCAFSIRQAYYHFNPRPSQEGRPCPECKDRHYH